MKIRTCLAAAAVAALLVGCSSEPEPEPLPPVPTTSPTPVALPLPSAAAAATPQGAAAFARYYFDLINQGLTSGDGAAVRAVSDPGCGGCRNLIGAMEQEPTPGERIEGGLFEIVSAESPPLEEGAVIVSLQYRVTEVRVLNDAGAVLRTTPAEGPSNGQLRLKRQGSSWIVLGFRGVE